MPETTRKRVLITAYACDPSQGSEPGAGWVWTREAGHVADVVVLTRDERPGGGWRSALQGEFDATGASVEVVVVPTPLDTGRFGRIGFRLRYLVWLVLAFRAARPIVRRGRIDVTHHLTYASDWLPSPGFFLGPPHMWGPVGGATYAPMRLARLVAGGSAASVAFDLTRRAVTSVLRAMTGSLAITRTISVIALNVDTACALRRYGLHVDVSPNAVVTVDVPQRGASRSADCLVYAGRLLAWKGLEIAIRALVEPGCEHLSLAVLGDGPDRARLERLCCDLGVVDRVVFRGRVDRDEVLRQVRDAAAFVFPSTHDSSGWAVAEAASLGVPVVCLDLGGPRELLDGTGVVVEFAPVDTLIRRYARGLLEAVDRPTSPVHGWGSDRVREVLATGYDRLAST